MSGPVIAFVGDSLTADGAWDGWFPNATVHNLGVAGDTTDTLIERLGTILELAPDTIVLLIGTNDLAFKATVEHVVRNVETILVTLRKGLPETHILVQSVMPREREYAPAIAEINRHLWQFAPTVHAGYLDLWPVLAEEDERIAPLYSDDGLNLTDAGYEAWLAELLPALETLSHQPTNTRSLPVITAPFPHQGQHPHQDAGDRHEPHP